MAAIKIVIARGADTLFNLESGNALVPTSQDERAIVFEALTEALAVLAGIRQQASFAATGGGLETLRSATAQCHSDQKSCDVVRLSERRDTRASVPKD